VYQKKKGVGPRYTHSYRGNQGGHKHRQPIQRRAAGKGGAQREGVFYSFPLIRRYGASRDSFVRKKAKEGRFTSYPKKGVYSSKKKER